MNCSEGREVSAKESSEPSRTRWLFAQEQEKKYLERVDDIKEWIRLRTCTWASLIRSLRGEIAFDHSKRILDIGGGPTSVFLALTVGERYVVDPLCDRVFELLPSLKGLEQYRDVNFVSLPLEEATFDRYFDIIFAINVFDHVGPLKSVIDKIDDLLAPSGTLVVVVDCYADPAVRKIMRFFDIDLPHPHHFVLEDIPRLFPNYRLVKQDQRVFEVTSAVPFRGQKAEIEVYRIDKFVRRMTRDLSIWGKKWDIFFAAKYFSCFSLALLISLLRRREKPFHPLKKARLFVFRKDSTPHQQ